MDSHLLDGSSRAGTLAQPLVVGPGRVADSRTPWCRPRTIMVWLAAAVVVVVVVVVEKEE
jgi:hypothetical protein